MAGRFHHTARNAMNRNYDVDSRVLDDIRVERIRQMDKFGPLKHMPPDVWMLIAGEEYGETCGAVLDAMRNGGTEEAVDQESIQLTAIMVAWREERYRGLSPSKGWSVSKPEVPMLVVGREYGNVCRALHDATYEDADPADVDRALQQMADAIRHWQDLREKQEWQVVPKSEHHYEAADSDAGSAAPSP